MGATRSRRRRPSCAAAATSSWCSGDEDGNGRGFLITGSRAHGSRLTAHGSDQHSWATEALTGSGSSSAGSYNASNDTGQGGQHPSLWTASVSALRETVFADEQLATECAGLIDGDDTFDGQRNFPWWPILPGLAPKWLNGCMAPDFESKSFFSTFSIATGMRKIAHDKAEPAPPEDGVGVGSVERKDERRS